MAWGLCDHPSSCVPAAIAPDVTKSTSIPVLRREASSFTNRAIRRLSRWPPSRVNRLVPILTTRRLIFIPHPSPSPDRRGNSLVNTLSCKESVPEGLVRSLRPLYELDFSNPDVVLGDRTSFGQLPIDAPHF